jgi:hypothetical protein
MKNAPDGSSCFLFAKPIVHQSCFHVQLITPPVTSPPWAKREDPILNRHDTTHVFGCFLSWACLCSLWCRLFCWNKEQPKLQTLKEEYIIMSLHLWKEEYIIISYFYPVIPQVSREAQLRKLTKVQLGAQKKILTNYSSFTYSQKWS